MNYREISEVVKRYFDQMVSGFGGELYNGVVDLDTLGPFETCLRLGSTIYTRNLDEGLCSPKMPEPYDGGRRFIIPEGVFFRAEIAMKPDDDDHFLATMFEGSGEHYLTRAHIATNDLNYVESHENIKWE
ncbi:hypothetical protein CMI42_04170 [Candidatus Pacearchaeota archaeon]|nr:hypothetical protein [Candidatus Pacearchaeota archaeon]